MPGRIRSKLTYANVASTIAIVAALGTGGAYAADTIGSSDIIDESILSQDVKNNQITWDDLALNSVTSSRIKDDSINGVDIVDGQVANGDLAADAVTADKIATNAVAQGEIATDGVAATEIQDNSIDAGEIVDFGLTNQDIGVLFSEVAADATLSNSSGGVTVTRIGAVG